MKKIFTTLSIILFSFVLCACQREEAGVVETIMPTETAIIFPTNTIAPSQTSTPTESRQLEPSATASPEPTQTVTPAPTEILCQQQTGSVEKFTMHSDLLRDPFQFRVYTPPCYSEFVEDEYPVLYLLHGLGFDDEQWDRIGVDEAMDRLIANGTIPPFILVLPKDNEGTSPINDPFGKAFMEDLMPFINENFRVKKERKYVGIGGISRGAAWAVHLGFQHWESFGVVGLHSLPVFYYDEWKVPIWLDEIPEGEFPRVYLDIGKRDRPQVLESAEWFTDQLDERWLPYEYYLFNGTHTEEYWSSHVEDYLLWYAAEWWE